ncbi:arylesterase [Vibrio metschnikovii]|uniref:multifunctional acyl-CoA thioesterase I/protease I/lysophospholipase L1 n=1 Tax=Vibrio metschnikovii TaxID=28172 RepID=UPI0001B95573|nr:multifunctional acyl-CoA thioesterase I/protease I/lysophospholipase L1 [Vibrio metschnikovii]EEX36013.1 arylesterase precursor [Vibrio metschnikovii CIP 69.14]SUP49914.1 arylesterase [Vibrio metschnikovii]SUQ10010.1 arylesterase [Vibrio metschnikovii]
MAKRLPLLFLGFIFSSMMLFTTTASSQTLLILGDSLSAGYQMPIEQAWPTLLESQLASHHEVTIINGSISGDTTGNGLARLPALLEQHQPQTVLITLGANDGLRGFPPQVVENNLRTMIEQIKQANAQSVLMQIKTPPNYGKRYSDSFADVYPRLAKEFDLPLIDFFLEQVIINPEWMMSDGLHPNSAAQPWIAQFMAQKLTPLL